MKKSEIKKYKNFPPDEMLQLANLVNQIGGINIQFHEVYG